MDKGHARALARSILARPISDGTREQYRRAARRLGGRHWRDYVADLVASRGVVGRSVVWVARAAWRRLVALAIMDALRVADRSPDPEERRAARRRMARLVEALEADLSEGPIQTTVRRKASKRRGLSRLPADWRAQMVRAAQPRDRWPLAVMAITGCRPAELRAGVILKALPDGRVKCQIHGVKVREGAGQPWREIVEDPRAALGHELGHALWKRLAEGGAIKVRIAPAGHAFQDRVSRLARRLEFGGVSAYSFRHQVAADLKALVAEGRISGAEASAALGHASARMRKHYGHRSQSRRCGGRALQVRAARPVRSPDDPGVDGSGKAPRRRTRTHGPGL
jgi:integrase